jgi:acetyl esterase
MIKHAIIIAAALGLSEPAVPAAPENKLTAEAEALVARLPQMALARRSTLPVELTGPPEAIAALDNITVPGPATDIAVRLYRPLVASARQPLLIWFHSGSWVRGGLDVEDVQLRAIANRSGWTIASVGYRLAPAHPAPAARDDGLAVLRWLADRADDMNIDPARIMVGGNSAGANIAASVALHDGRTVPLAALALIQPIVDLTLASQSWRELGSRNYVIGTEGMQRDVASYLADRIDAADPAVSPLFATNLADLPPTLIIAAGVDPAHDDAIAMAQRLKQAKVPTELHVVPGVPHGFFLFSGVLREGIDARNRLADWLALRSKSEGVR